MHFVLQAININYNSILQFTNLKILSSYEIYFVHTPEVFPHTIEHVICVFGLVLDLVLVFVGFGLFQICSPFSISPHSNDHTLQCHALQNILKSVTYVFCMFFSQKFLGLLWMLQNFKNSLHLLEIFRAILQYCHCLYIFSQNMGPKKRDLGNVTCPTQFRRVV